MEEIDGAQITSALKSADVSLLNASLKGKIDVLSKMMAELIKLNSATRDFKIPEKTLKWYDFHSSTQPAVSPIKAKATAKVAPKPAVKTKKKAKKARKA